MNWWADRTLAAFAGPGYIHLSTYNFCAKGCDSFNTLQNVDYGGDLTKWWFIYFGYSYKLRKITAYIRFETDNREKEISIADVTHMIPDSLMFIQGKDKYYPGFNGNFKDFKVAYGPGAFVEGLPNYLNMMYLPGP